MAHRDRPGSTSWAARLLVAAAAAASLLFLWAYAVDVPLVDEWDIVPPLWESAASGTLDLRLLAAPHNEHRILVPRLVYLAFVAAFGWNTIALMLLTQVLLLFMAVACARLVSETIAPQPSRLIVPLAICLLLVYSPAQWETLLMGLEFHLATPAACLLGIILVARRGWPLAPTLLASAVLAGTATFSLANGLLCWLLAPLLVLATPRPRRGGDGVWWGLWALAAVSHIGLYARGLRGASAPIWLDPASLDLLHVMRGLAAFIGRPLATVPAWPPDPAAAIALGASALASFALLLAWLATNRRDRTLIERAMPWVALALYGIGSGVLAVFARTGYFVWMTMANRYVTVSVWALIGVIMLAALWHERRRGADGRVPAPARAAWAGLSVAVVALYAAALPAELRRAGEAQRANLQGRAALVFADVVTAFPAVLHPDPAIVPARLPGLHAAGLLARPGAGVRWDSDAGDDDRCRYGTVTAAGRTDAGRLDLEGWAFLPDSRRPADAVVVTTGLGPKPWPLAVMFPGEPMPEAVGVGGVPPAGSAWRLESPAAGTAGGLRVWAFDAARARAYLLCRR